MTLCYTTPDNTQLISLVADARLTNYFAVASFVWVLYDHLITLEEEVELIWKGERSFPNLLYLANRYYTLITFSIIIGFMFSESNSNTTCRVFLQFERVLATILVVNVDLILAFRVWVLYERRRRLLYFFAVCLLLEMLTMLVMLSVPVKYLNGFTHVGDILPGCNLLDPAMKGFYSFYNIPPIVMSFVIFVLTLYKCGTVLHREKTLDLPIVSLFLRDGILWFFAILLVGTAQIVLWARATSTVSQVLILPYLAVHSVGAARVLLNIKSLLAAFKAARESVGAEGQALLGSTGSRKSNTTA